MKTDLLHPAVAPRRTTPTHAVRALALGLFGGLTLGVAARAWMRLIAEEPAFTWSGTIFIVAGFAIFGLTRSIVAIAHGREWRGVLVTNARLVGGVGSLPLLEAAR